MMWRHCICHGQIKDQQQRFLTYRGGHLDTGTILQTERDLLWRTCILVSNWMKVLRAASGRMCQVAPVPRRNTQITVTLLENIKRFYNLHLVQMETWNHIWTLKAAKGGYHPNTTLLIDLWSEDSHAVSVWYCAKRCPKKADGLYSLVYPITAPNKVWQALGNWLISL